MIRPYGVRRPTRRPKSRFRAATRAAHGATLPCWARNASLLRSTYKLHDIWRICNKILRKSEKKMGAQNDGSRAFGWRPGYLLRVKMRTDAQSLIWTLTALLRAALGSVMDSTPSLQVASTLFASTSAGRFTSRRNDP